jgi:Fic family protein
MVDLLAENPYWTVKHAAARLDVAFTTAARAIDRLVETGIMERVGDARRDRLFCATEILAVLEEPAVLGRESDLGV